jgi:predicted nucleic-acid-binding Zn-ribbon protein
MGSSLNQRVAETKIHGALQEIKKRGVAQDYCPRCNTNNWNADLLEIPAFSLMASLAPLGPGYISTGETRLSVLAVVCMNCGYTMLHNLQVLGIAIR